MTGAVMRKTIERGTVREELAVAFVLAQTGGELTLANLTDLYSGGDTDTRWVILLAERVMRVPGMETQLRQVAQNETDLDLRAQAFMALADLGDTAILPTVTAALDHENVIVREAALYCYETLTGEAYR